MSLITFALQLIHYVVFIEETKIKIIVIVIVFGNTGIVPKIYFPDTV